MKKQLSIAILGLALVSAAEAFPQAVCGAVTQTNTGVYLDEVKLIPADAIAQEQLLEMNLQTGECACSYGMIDSVVNSPGGFDQLSLHKVTRVQCNLITR